MKDGYGRTISYLRISVTDRCNERCLYCMPAEGIRPVRHGDLLSFEEIERVVKAAAGLGIRDVRLTGGEPCVRRNLPVLVRKIAGVSGINSVSMTTNGTLLAPLMQPLYEAGLRSVNLSLDTLDETFYARLTRTGRLQDALDGLESACAYPDVTVKIDTVLTGRAEQKLTDVALLAKERPVHVRFIELMPIGLGRTFAGAGGVKSAEEAERVLTEKFGPPEREPDFRPGHGPAVYVRYPGFQGRIGFIAAVSHRFCSRCNRLRLTSEGFLKTCLQYADGTELRPLLRDPGMTDADLERAVREAILNKPKEHRFYESMIEHEEQADMNQIGG